MVKIARMIYLVLAWLFVAGVVGQVFLVGMVVVARQFSWNPHIGLGHVLSLPLILMLISMYLARAPGGLKWRTWALFGIYILQADVLIFLRQQVPVLAALHPVLALADFALGLALARSTVLLARQEQQPAPARVGREAQSAD